MIEHLALGPVHLTSQDIGGVSTFRLAADHPELIRSYAAIETALPGFGLEMLADVTHGGTWHFTFATMAQVAQNVTEAKLDGVGHLAALEDPKALAETLLGFYRTLNS